MERQSGETSDPSRTARYSRRELFTRVGQAGLLVGVASLASACGPAAAPAAAPQKLTQVRFTCGANLGYTPLYVGEGTDIFKKHSIDGSVVLFDVGFQGTEAMIAGQAETSGTVEFPLFNYLTKGADIVIPAIMITAEDLKIVCLNSIQKPADLAGKKVGYLFGSSADYAFNAYLKKFNVPKDKVNHINVPNAEQVALFVKGDIDAYIWVEPNVTKGLEAMAGKAHKLDPSIDAAYTTRTYLEMMRPWVEKNQDATVEILKALIEAKQFTEKEPQKTAEIAAKKLNLNAADIPGLFKTGGFHWDIYLDAAAISVFQDVQAWLQENGKLTGTAPDFKKLFVPEYLRKIDPNLVKGF